MNIGVFGGAFDPPHLGHIDDARRAFEQLGLDRLIVIPSGISPHKERSMTAAPPRHRLQMAKLAFEPISGFTVSDMEVSRTGKSYTADTLEQLKKQFPNDSLWFIMGSDMLLSFEHWYAPERIAKNASLAFLNRGSDQRELDECIRRLERKFSARVRQIENSYIDVSSTKLRMLLPLGCMRDMVPTPVLAYILQNGLHDTAPQAGHSEELLQWALRRVDQKRGEHIRGVCETALWLADRYGCDRDKAFRAAALHDVTKLAKGEQQLALCRLYGYRPDDIERQMPQLLHAKTGALAAKKLLNQSDDIVSAVFWHTTGKPDMTLLEKIICLADYIEPNRDFPGVETLRTLARESVDTALRAALASTVALLKNKNSLIHPNSLASLRWLEGLSV